ncbi:WAS/WASL-interacting protein family member 1-like isoform X2 [Prorops nasuta]|uniref:WAS/WASL-interacting protein family member 1-like isoform X2 n=1 Tax=Prorops nasuta TaxID=863751 RepID=UPI0034CED355
MPAPPPPPPPTFNIGNAGGDQGRGMLLQSIRAGKTLRKTVTVDKSGPAISGKVTGETGAQYSGYRKNETSNINSTSNVSNTGTVNLSGIFLTGIPKLKQTGLRNNIVERDVSNPVNVTSNNTSFSGSNTIPSTKRGPPPEPPPSAQKPICRAIAQGHSSLDNSCNTNETTKLSKPALASRPAQSSFTNLQKPSPPPKKLTLPGGGTISRAQSMRLPCSPPVLAPIQSSLHQSQDYLNETQPRPANRILRPPIARPPSPPTSRASSVATRAAPPPPPSRGVTAPTIPPPDPPVPHRPAPPQHQRLAPLPPLPPTPPTRSLSMRNGQAAVSIDLDIRFADMFHPVSSFPPPEPFRGFPKVYSSRNAKQPAPAPPLRSSTTSNTMLPLNNSASGKQWQQNATSLAY